MTETHTFAGLITPVNNELAAIIDNNENPKKNRLKHNE
jgi:hypothetical protein